MKKSKKDKAQNEVVDTLNEVGNQEEQSRGGDSAAEVQEWKDKYLRLYSEFDNYKKRTTRERLDLLKNASADVLSELLPVADDFDRIVASLEAAKMEGNQALLEGIKLVQHKFMNTLDRQGLKFFEAREKDFDPDFHEAITKIPAPNKKLKGKVVDVVEKGYMLNDRVLRYAKVVVGE